MSGTAASASTTGIAAAGQGIAYAPPVLAQLVGPGVRNANTAGGQAVTLIGSQFGPFSYPNTTGGYISLTYTANGLTFSAASCSVPATTTMTCITGPGIGAGWSIIGTSAVHSH